MQADCAIRDRSVTVVQTYALPILWPSGWINAIVMGFTFASTLMLPIEQAVMLGVLATFILQIFRAANRLELLQLIPRPDGLYEERFPPTHLLSRSEEHTSELQSRGHLVC